MIQRTGLLGSALLFSMLFVAPAYSQTVVASGKVAYTGTYGENTCFVGLTLSGAAPDCGCKHPTVACSRFDFNCSTNLGKRAYATALTALAGGNAVTFVTQKGTCYNSALFMGFKNGKGSYFLMVP